MKRFGNGWAFYGERETLKEKDYEQLAAEMQEIANYRPQRPDSVLIVGATGELGNWVTLKVWRVGMLCGMSSNACSSRLHVICDEDMYVHGDVVAVIPPCL
jgi:hypothetical protein